MTGWLREPSIVRDLGRALADLLPDADPTVVVGPATSGYPLGALLAVEMGAGFVGVQKERRALADSDVWLNASTPLDYRGRNLELTVRKRLLTTADRVVIVDDWVDTGGQAFAVQEIVRRSGARLLGTVAVVDALTDHAVRRRLGLRSLLNLRDVR